MKKSTFTSRIPNTKNQSNIFLYFFAFREEKNVNADVRKSILLNQVVISINLLYKYLHSSPILLVRQSKPQTLPSGRRQE